MDLINHFACELVTWHTLEQGVIPASLVCGIKCYSHLYFLLSFGPCTGMHDASKTTKYMEWPPASNMGILNEAETCSVMSVSMYGGFLKKWYDSTLKGECQLVTHYVNDDSTCNGILVVVICLFWSNNAHVWTRLWAYNSASVILCYNIVMLMFIQRTLLVGHPQQQTHFWTTLSRMPLVLVGPVSNSTVHGVIRQLVIPWELLLTLVLRWKGTLQTYGICRDRCCQLPPIPPKKG